MRRLGFILGAQLLQTEADNLGQSHQALEATLGAHTLITPTRLDQGLHLHLKFRYQVRDLVRRDNYIWGLEQLCTCAWGRWTKYTQCNRGREFEKCDFCIRNM